MNKIILVFGSGLVILGLSISSTFGLGVSGYRLDGTIDVSNVRASRPVNMTVVTSCVNGGIMRRSMADRNWVNKCKKAANKRYRGSNRAYNSRILNREKPRLRRVEKVVHPFLEISIQEYMNAHRTQVK